MEVSFEFRKHRSPSVGAGEADGVDGRLRAGHREAQLAIGPENPTESFRVRRPEFARRPRERPAARGASRPPRASSARGDGRNPRPFSPWWTDGHRPAFDKTLLT